LNPNAQGRGAFDWLLIYLRRTPVSRFALLGALALVSAMAATKVTAQEVIYNPGYCAQFYPNANCQNKGPNNPYTGDYQLRSELRGAFARSGNPCALGAESYRGRNGRRYYCY
jgi:hypothetical protein